MTPITELQEILKAELYDFKVNFNYNEAIEELKSADQAKSLPELFKSLLKVVNRYQNTHDEEIKKTLIKYEQVLRLIKIINRPDNSFQETYKLALTEFQNKNNEQKRN